MKIHESVEVGQTWRSNDPRRLRAVLVLNICTYETGHSIKRSLVQHRADTETHDRVRVMDIVNHRITTLRRDQFSTGVRGWSLDRQGGLNAPVLDDRRSVSA